ARAGKNRGVVDDTIGRAVGRQRCADGGGDLRCIRKVDLKEMRLAAGVSRLFEDLFAELGVDIPDRDLGAVARETPAERLAESAAAARHHHDISALYSVARDPVTRHVVLSSSRR